ncbi:Uu.00g043490.m01.CDS01 [Anthostomella pinea]|uniref:Uu.00g043490.m01.CDS01 n=1 Tax=Anthostomella pinea TaxID=933095 RepID=A0AAI8YE50_9PEZI|nr:Uu.00g043490.m01.CDS01 [Anthostomella pinea]
MDIPPASAAQDISQSTAPVPAPTSAIAAPSPASNAAHDASHPPSPERSTNTPIAEAPQNATGDAASTAVVTNTTNGVNGISTNAVIGSHDAVSTPLPPSVPTTAPAPPAPMSSMLPLTPSSNHQQPIIPPARPPIQRQTSEAQKGFASPKANHHQQVPKFNEDISQLSFGVAQASPQAVRRVVRDNWEKALLGSEFHHAFLLNAVIHHANGVVIRRAIKDFGEKMITEAKHEVISHYTPKDLDAVRNLILERCSDRFLDQALEKRLKTIDARSLINALARAERLGYENSDVLDDQKEKVVHVAAPSAAPSAFTPVNPSPRPIQHPQHQQQPPQLPPQQPPPQYRQVPQNLPPVRTAAPVAPVRAAAPVAELQCRLCWKKFNATAPYEYHVQKQICTKEAPNGNEFPFTCEHCGSGFITKIGKQYHIANAVCGDHKTAPATPRAPVASSSPMAGPPGYSTPAQPPAQPYPSTQSYYPSSQQLPASSPRVGTPSQPSRLPTSIQASGGDDPYSHLTPLKRAELNEALREAEVNYAPRFREAELIQDPIERKVKLDGIQNSFSTKQSIIRKKYGVRLRQRRTKEEIEQERVRMGTLKHGAPTTSYGHDTPSAKRQRVGSVGYQTPQPVPVSSVPEPSNHHSVSDMNNSGLGGSSATVATTDPTASMSSAKQTPIYPPQNSLSSLQRQGYRVSSHVGGQTPTNGSAPESLQRPSNLERSGSASAPVVLDDDDSSGSDTDTDGDIPATIPPQKPSGTPQTGTPA